MTVQTQETLLKKLKAIDQMPTLPVVLTPLLHYMEQPLERLEVQQVVDLISQDKSLTAQCLQLANSPLFGQWQKIDSVRAAVMALGMQRMRDVAMSFPYSHFCRVRRRASTQLFFGNTLLAARLFAGSSRAKSGFPSRGKLTWQACSTILVSSLSCGLHPPSSAPPWNALPLSTFRCTKLSKLYSELITPRAAGLWLSAGTSHPI